MRNSGDLSEFLPSRVNLKCDLNLWKSVIRVSSFNVSHPKKNFELSYSGHLSEFIQFRSPKHVALYCGNLVPPLSLYSFGGLPI
jgi:hypothetical protein